MCVYMYVCVNVYIACMIYVYVCMFMLFSRKNIYLRMREHLYASHRAALACLSKEVFVFFRWKMKNEKNEKNEIYKIYNNVILFLYVIENNNN